MKALIVVLALCAALVSGCAKGVKVVAGAGKVAGAEARAAHAANKGRTLAATYTSDLGQDDSWDVVRVGCEANDWVDALQAADLGAAVKQIWIDAGGDSTLHYRMYNLAVDLRNESTAWDRYYKVGVFVVCETA